MNRPYRIAFFGTPQFGVPALTGLLNDPNFKVELVVSQPDRPAGRKLKLTPSAIKSFALSKGLPVVTPVDCRSSEFIESYKKLNLDAAVVIAFGQILNQTLLDIHPNKFVNVHASLLPRWRGAAPIQRAIMAGDKKTGVSLQVMVKKLDAGDIIGEQGLLIDPQETAIDLHDKLSLLGLQLCTKDFKFYLDGDVKPYSQDENLVTYASKIEKSESMIDWCHSAYHIWNQIRGLQLGPGGACWNQGKRLKIIKAEPISNDTQGLNFGQIFEIQPDYFLVNCGERSALKILKVQPESKGIQNVKDYLHGSHLKPGDVLT